MAGPTLGFRPMTQADIPLVLDWLRTPHVMQWWPWDGLMESELTRGLEAPWMRYFLLTLDDEPFGFLQVYDIWREHACADDYEDAEATGPYDDQPEGTLGIDQFIGREDMLGQGHGSAAIRLVVDDLLAGGAPRVITDPDPANPRAVRAYEKAGFRSLDVRETDDGPVLLMVRDP